MQKNAKPCGFTLIELMIVVAIVGVLAAIAYPSYVEQVRKGRRADAQSALLELAQQLERHYTTNNSYTSASLDIGVTGRVSAHYTISFSAKEAQSYTIQAQPTGTQANDTCGAMTVTHTGERTPGTAGCWK